METVLFLAGLAVVSLGGSFISSDVRLRNNLRYAGYALLACVMLVLWSR